nr:hypothetical protein [Tanacetum cinerariifolium]
MLSWLLVESLERRWLLEGSHVGLEVVVVDDESWFERAAEGFSYDDSLREDCGLGIDLTTLVKTIPEPADDDHMRILFKKKKESARKDVERAFRVLKKKWTILANPTRALKKDKIVNMMTGHNYTVSYDVYPGFTHEEDVKHLSWKFIRPLPPMVEVSERWVPGDEVEMFHKLSWKMAIVLDDCSWNGYLVRLVGSLEELEVTEPELRVRQSYQNGEWVDADCAEQQKCYGVLPIFSSKKRKRASACCYTQDEENEERPLKFRVSGKEGRSDSAGNINGKAPMYGPDGWDNVEAPVRATDVRPKEVKFVVFVNIITCFVEMKSSIINQVLSIGFSKVFKEAQKTLELARVQEIFEAEIKATCKEFGLRDKLVEDDQLQKHYLLKFIDRFSSIGSKLLERMRWEGCVLGKYGQGILLPIEVNTHPNNLLTTNAIASQEPLSEENEEEDEALSRPFKKKKTEHVKNAQRKKGHDSEKRCSVQADSLGEKESEQSSEHHDDTPNEEATELPTILMGVKFQSHLLDQECQKISSFTGRDEVRWELGNDATFTVKETREHINDNILPTLDAPNSWCKSIPRKMNIFLWRKREAKHSETGYGDSDFEACYNNKRRRIDIPNKEDTIKAMRKQESIFTSTECANWLQCCATNPSVTVPLMQD